MKIYVNEQARFGGDGTMEHPLQTIGEAAKLARPGDEVIVSGWIQRMPAPERPELFTAPRKKGKR